MVAWCLFQTIFVKMLIPIFRKHIEFLSNSPPFTLILPNNRVRHECWVFSLPNLIIA